MKATFPGWEDPMGTADQTVTSNRGRDRASLSPRCSIHIATAVAFVIVASFSLIALSQTISATDVIIRPDQVGNIVIKMDHLPNGLSGYVLRLELSERNIGIIKNVNFIAFDGASRFQIPSDGNLITLSAYDLDNTVQPGVADVKLCKIEVQGNIIGEGTILITIKMMDDEDGNPVNPQIRTGSLRVTETGPPTADFSFSLPLPTDLDTIHFMDQSSGQDGPIVSWKWDFGDGETSSEKNPPHRYADDGRYHVTLTVTDNDGATDTVTKHITVSNVAPKADFTFSPSEPTDLDTIHFVDQSGDRDGKIVAWKWDFGDGRTSSKKNPSHKYADNGTYQVTLTVIDNDGTTDAVTKAIAILNVAPKADFTFSPPEPTDLDTIHFVDQSGDRDGEIVAWKWDFGDGKTSTERTPFHRYFDNGIYTISLKATDEDGATNETRKTIKILNTPPTAKFTFSASKPNINEDVTFNAAASADSDGRIAVYEWDWDNNGRFETRRTSPTISLPFNYCGSYTIVLRVIDDDGASNTVVHTMKVNCNPIAKYTFSPANPKPGQSITLDASGARDPDGRIMRYEWDWNNDGRFEYSAFSPRARYAFTRQGTYKVVLRVTDDNGATTTAVQRIPVENPPKPPPSPPENWENEEEVEEYFKQLIAYSFEEYPLIAWPAFIILVVIGLLTSE